MSNLLVTFIQALSTVPLPILALLMLCLTLVIIVFLLLLALRPSVGSTVIEIIKAWRQK
jgi:hypothetical protein